MLWHSNWEKAAQKKSEKAGSTLINKQSVTLQQPSESDTDTTLSNFTNDSGISTTQDGVNYTVTQQGNDYQIDDVPSVQSYSNARSNLSGGAVAAFAIFS